MIKKEEVQHIAKLARLGLKESDIKKFQKELSEILDYFNLLKEADVSEVEPTYHPAERFLKIIGPARKDEAKLESADVIEKIIESAPDKERNYIKVKSVLK